MNVKNVQQVIYQSFSTGPRDYLLLDQQRDVVFIFWFGCVLREIERATTRYCDSYVGVHRFRFSDAILELAVFVKPKIQQHLFADLMIKISN